MVVVARMVSRPEFIGVFLVLVEGSLDILDPADACRIGHFKVIDIHLRLLLTRFGVAFQGVLGFDFHNIFVQQFIECFLDVLLCQ